MANPKQPPSDELGEILRRLLDESGVYETRRDWAHHLKVNESLVSRWVSGDVVIRPEELEKIVQTVETRNSYSAARTLAFFWARADQPPETIAPLRSLKCSLGEWIVLALQERLTSELSKHPGERQRQMYKVFFEIMCLVSR